jgi:hypothetical protein
MSVRQWLGLTLAVALMGHVGCYNKARFSMPTAPPSERPEQHLMGITLKDGTEVMFDRPAAVAGGQVSGLVKKQERQYPVTDVQRFWIWTKTLSKGRTVALVAGVGAAVALSVVAIKVAGDLGSGSWGGGGAKCCLYVYSWDGEKYILDTETATGAVSRGLERDEVSLLQHVREQGGEYHLLLSNDNDETQYTDLVELWAVDHAPGLKPRAASDGKLYAVMNPLPPIETSGEITLTFPKPRDAREAKLVTSATLTPWAGEVGGRLLGLLGRDLPLWYQRIDNEPAARAELLGWMAREEMFALKIQVEEADGWRVRGMMPVAGPFVFDERVVPLDVSRVVGDRVRIRMQPPPGFWAFHSFAIDYSGERPLSVTRLLAREARDWAGRDLTAELRAADGNYFEMPEQWQRAAVMFAAPPRVPGMKRTLFLHTRGYYRMHRPADTPPDWETYRHILQTPGAAAAWLSKQQSQ